MRSQLDLAQSTAPVHFAQKEEKKLKAAAATEGLFDLASIALAELRTKDNGVSKLNTKGICATATSPQTLTQAQEVRPHVTGPHDGAR